jgi:hypothetical protein
MKKGGKDIEEEKEKDIQIKQARIHLIDLVVVRVKAACQFQPLALPDLVHPSFDIRQRTRDI